MTIRTIRGPKEYEILCRVCDSVAGFQQRKKSLVKRLVTQGATQEDIKTALEEGKQ